MDNIYSVSTLTGLIRDLLVSTFPLVWVRGEVTNISFPASGHIYFTLKDADAQLQCVFFAGRQRGAEQFNPITGEIYASPRPNPRDFLRNGLDLLCVGSLEVYEPRGQYQLLVQMAEPAGEGLLALEFERRKAALSAKGYFAPERKRPLPVEPSKVALITSPKGAAIHDFLKVAEDRGLGSIIRLFPVPVQGTEAAGQIAQAIAEANSQNWAEVIVLIRGGGSLEDLWAFNEEIVAAAIYNSRLPVLAGIGHEVDKSLADMTADMRAATPSHAAQLLWKPRNELEQRLDLALMALHRQQERHIQLLASRYDHLIRVLQYLSPVKKLERMTESLTALTGRLRKSGDAHMEDCQRRLNLAIAARQRAPQLRQYVAMQSERVKRLAAAIPQAVAHSLEGRTRQVEATLHTLQALDPYAPLARGYALLMDAEKVVTSVSATAVGRPLQAVLRDGTLAVTVRGVRAGAPRTGE